MSCVRALHYLQISLNPYETWKVLRNFCYHENTLACLLSPLGPKVWNSFCKIQNRFQINSYLFFFLLRTMLGSIPLPFKTIRVLSISKFSYKITLLHINVGFWFKDFFKVVLRIFLYILNGPFN